MKQQDITLGESGGKEGNEFNDILEKWKPQLEATIDNAYNVGIDHCVGLMKSYCEKLKPYTRNGQPYFSEPHVNQLIDQLEALKNQQYDRYKECRGKGKV